MVGGIAEISLSDNKLSSNIVYDAEGSIMPEEISIGEFEGTGLIEIEEIT